MDRRNFSFLTELIFLGITDNTENKMALFTMVLLVYLINLLANLGMITLCGYRETSFIDPSKIPPTPKDTDLQARVQGGPQGVCDSCSRQ